jgi:hypothetical protein
MHLTAILKFPFVLAAYLQTKKAVYKLKGSFRFIASALHAWMFDGNLCDFTFCTAVCQLTLDVMVKFR